MTIKVRNTVFISGLSAAGLLFILFVTGVGYLLYTLGLSIDSIIDPASSFFNIPRTFLLQLFALLSGIILLYSFRKTSSPEVFFFIVFLLLFALESFRLGLIYVQETGLPFETGRMFSRIIYFGRYLGTICIFLSGLFSCGIRNQRIELLLGIGFLIALSLATTIPLDSRSTEFNLIYSNALEKIFFIGFMIIKVLGVWNFFYAGIISGNSNYYLIGLGVFLITAGKELCFNFRQPVLFLAGLTMMITGTLIFGIRIHKIYLWF